MQTRFLETGFGKIAYDDSGSGPLVVCVPGMGDLRGEYRFLAPQLLEAGYRVVSIDVRGHGQSSTVWDDFSVAGVGADILALLRKLDAGPAVLIGTSMGAGAAVWVAVEGPELVRKLVLIGPFVRSETTWPLRLLYSAMFSRPWGPAMWKMYYSSLYPNRKPDDFAQYAGALQVNLAEKGRLEALHQMLLASKRASEERVTRVKAPALVLMGARDPDFKNPEDEARWLAGGLKCAYHMIPGAGHYPQAEMPEAVVALLLPFLMEVTHAA